MPFPMPRPMSGSRLAPKIRMMIRRMMMSSGTPRLPMALPFGKDEDRGDSTILRASRFGGGPPPQDQSMIVGIGSEVEVLAPLSSDRPAQMRALSALAPWGTTGLHDALLQSIDAIQAAKGRRALLLLSDGSDRYSTATAAEALDRARGADVMIYPIAIGGARPALFAELAALTGGRSFQPGTPAEVNGIV